ncbi:MAG: STAS domain-containing protein [Candidatus Rifleibacteriota bacterium]
MAGNIEFKFNNKVFIAEIYGYAEVQLMEELAEKFFEKLDEGFQSFIFNFSHMTLINSSALGKLLEIISEAMGNDQINLSFCSIPSTSKLGMSSLGMLEFVTEYDSIEEALENIVSV